jgi:hypothetical protein
LPCLPVGREEQASNREWRLGRAGDAALEQRGTDEKQRGTRSSRGWWPGGAGDAAPTEEG